MGKFRQEDSQQSIPKDLTPRVRTFGVTPTGGESIKERKMEVSYSNLNPP